MKIESTTRQQERKVVWLEMLRVKKCSFKNVFSLKVETVTSVVILEQCSEPDVHPKRLLVEMTEIRFCTPGSTHCSGQTKKKKIIKNYEPIKSVRTQNKRCFSVEPFDPPKHTEIETFSTCRQSSHFRIQRDATTIDYNYSTRKQ